MLKPDKLAGLPVGCALFWAQVSCYSTRWGENKATFLIEFGAWEDVDMSQDFGKVVAVHRFSCCRPLQFWRNFLTQIHVFPCSKLQKKGTAVFSSLSSIRWDLSPKKAHTINQVYHWPQIVIVVSLVKAFSVKLWSYADFIITVCNLVLIKIWKF